MHHHDLKLQFLKFRKKRRTAMCPTVMLDICCDLFATITCSLQLVRIEWIRKQQFSKNVVSSKTTVFECAQKSLIFDIGKHFDIN